MSEQVFIEALKSLGIVLTEKQKLQFKIYANYLLEYNSHTNLTAIKTIDEVYLKHFYDSLLILKYEKISGRVLDIGSGAGFPGIPLKIINPEIDLYLLDSNGKKAAFLNSLKDKLDLNYSVINDRAELYIKDVRETFDMVVSRAVAALNVLVELSLPFVKIGGKFISYKGQSDEEVELAEYGINALGGNISSIKKTTLFDRGDIRTFIIIEKKCKTDSKYPRAFEKISKNPLQKKSK